MTQYSLQVIDAKSLHLGDGLQSFDVHRPLAQPGPERPTVPSSPGAHGGPTTTWNLSHRSPRPSPLKTRTEGNEGLTGLHTP